MHKAIKSSGTVAMALLEAFVLLEILWYYLHDGEQTLHEAVGEYLRGFAERTKREVTIQDTLEMIRDLPETNT